MKIITHKVLISLLMSSVGTSRNEIGSGVEEKSEGKANKQGLSGTRLPIIVDIQNCNKRIRGLFLFIKFVISNLQQSAIMTA